MRVIQIITAEECKAARALLGWNTRDLASKSGISFNSISNFERGVSGFKTKGNSFLTMDVIARTFNDQGVFFEDNEEEIIIRIKK